MSDTEKSKSLDEKVLPIVDKVIDKMVRIRITDDRVYLGMIENNSVIITCNI